MLNATFVDHLIKTLGEKKAAEYVGAWDKSRTVEAVKKTVKAKEAKAPPHIHIHAEEKAPASVGLAFTDALEVLTYIPHVDQDERERMAFAFFITGNTQREIGKSQGCSTANVSYHLRAWSESMGLNLRKYGKAIITIRPRKAA